MAVLISARDLSHRFGARPLFSHISFTVSEGDHIGLIGPNGAGKSTLLSILAGAFPPDSGQVTRKNGLSVALLRQVPVLDEKTVRDAVRNATPKAQEESWQTEARVDEWLNRLQLDGNALVATLSGGWLKRVALARELIQEPDLLLLDEPTNHLDVESILWLEGVLQAARFATIIITHDRLFLQRTTKRILELDRRNENGMLDVDGDYTTYLERKAEAVAADQQRHQSLENTLRRETEWLRRGAAARSTKQKARIQRADALENEVGELGERTRTGKVGLDFQSSDEGRRPKRLIEARGISKRFGEQLVFENVDLLITPKTRLGLLGPNGCGKSTLLRVLLGDEAPTSGEVVRADSLQVAYFAQDRSELDPNRSLAETVSPDSDSVIFKGASLHRNAYLERFLFRSEQLIQPVATLSGGEKSRLSLACLMLKPANVLVLDEPTNDLDLETLAVLEDALDNFDGAVLLVTHDRYFLDRVTNQIIAFHTLEHEKGQTTMLSDLAQWEQWFQTQTKKRRAKPESAEKSGTPAVRKPKKLGFKDQRDWDTLEQRILEAETKLANLEAECARPEVTTDSLRLTALGAELERARAEVDALYARWAELEAMQQ